QCLSAVAIRLEPKEAAQVVATLTQAIKYNKDFRVLEHLVGGLTAVSVRLEPKEAARVAGQAAAILTQAMKVFKEPDASRLAFRLSAVSSRLEPREAAQVAATLIQAIKDTKDPNTLHQLVLSLSGVLAR